MIIEKHYETLRHLRMAKSYVDDIQKLNFVLNNFKRNQAIALLSKLTLKYEKGIDQIGFYLSGRPVIKGQIDNLYGDRSTDDLVADIEYLIDCIVIIGAVNFGLAPSIESILEELAIEEDEYDDDFYDEEDEYYNDLDFE